MPITLTTLKEIADAIKSLIDMTHTVKVNAAMLGVQEKLLDLQEKLFAHREACFNLQEKYKSVLDECDALKKRLADIEKFQTYANRYTLKKLAPGFSAYVLKASAANGEPAHWLCQDCLAHGEIGSIQKSADDAFEKLFPGENTTTHLRYMRCGATFTMPDEDFAALHSKYA